MIATRPATLKENYHKVSDVEYKISLAQRELYFVEQKEQRQIAAHTILNRKPETEENNRQLTKVEAEIISTLSLKSRLQDRIADLEERLPIVLDQAKKIEADLVAKMEEVEKIKTEVTGIDKELTKSLREPMKLIEQRTEAVQHLAETKSQVSHLIGELHWNDPLKDEPVPLEPAILDELKKLIDPHPNVVHWRGKN